MAAPHRIQVVCTYSLRPDFQRWLRRRVRDDTFLTKRVTLTLPADPDAIPAALAEAEVLAAIKFSPEAFKAAPSLKWLQLGLAGADSAMFPAMRKSDVIVTSAVGTHDETVPQAAWSFVLAFATGLHEGYRQKHNHEWNRKPIVLSRIPLSQQTICIIGAGRIGTGIARLAKHSGMQVIGVRRHPRRERPPHFDRIVGPRGMPGALAAADYVVLIVPGGPGSNKLIGSAELRQMKRSAYLINVARGSVVDERALISALRAGRIAGAGLDVFATEPLPPDHPFYEMPNVAMTPHTSGDTADYSYRAAELFLTNLRRYLRGRPLLNRVDKNLGY